MAKKSRGTRAESGIESIEPVASIEGEAAVLTVPEMMGHEPTEALRPAERCADAPLIRRLEFPLADPPAGSYISAETLGHLDARLNSPEQLTGLRRVHAGLVAAGAKLASGKPVVTKSDVLRYVFEQLGG